jgi:hypothetical protein
MGMLMKSWRLLLMRNEDEAGCRWFTSVTLATQEAEIRRIAVQSQPGQMVHKTLSQKTLHKKGWRSGSR